LAYLIAVPVTAWAAWRWLGFVAGTLRIRRYPAGPVRKEARRAVVQSGSWTIWVTTGAVVAWMAAADVRLTENFGGFVAAVLMGSLAVGVAAAMMQPAERTPETLDICRLRRPRG
jgi:uncharacterized membrane protein (DUF441 family)